MNSSKIQEAIASNIASQFDIVGQVSQVGAFGSGHINDTYRVVTNGNCDYLLQRINHHVFKDVDALMRNIMLVTQHLKQKYVDSAPPGDEQRDRVLTLIPTVHGTSYLQDQEGDFWRMFILLANTRSYDIVETPRQAREGGRAFGQFQRLLADLDAKCIHEVLPNFHHIGKRLAALYAAVEADGEGRVGRVRETLAFIAERKYRMGTILDLAEGGELPLRITHNDTKFNNVLLDAEDRAQCVIDLDTVMPGYIAYDFGDAIRTIINRAAEDEADLEKVKLNIPLFQAYTEGYLEETGGFLTDQEINSLIEGVLLLPYMQAVRFLTDFLEGDHYYKVKHPNHNLQRTLAQLRLVAEIEAHEPQLRQIIREAVDVNRFA